VKVIGWPGSAFALWLAVRLGCQCSELFVRRFPDGESLVRIDTDVAGAQVAVATTLDHADNKALPLIFAADALRELGASRVVLVAPYLGYMRQDARFNPGEAVTSRSFARLLSSSFDALVTVDPHLHRWKSLGEIYTIPTRIVASAKPIAQWIESNVTSPLIVGADAESEQWVSEVARIADAPWTVMKKTRLGDRDVRVELADSGSWGGRMPVLVDDVVSTGHTLMAAAGALMDAGLPSPIAIAVHALFDDAAQARMEAGGIAQIVTCDTIAHSTNGISILPGLVHAVKEVMA
jgi:ribose-phosphate pyrophosphokinase